MSYSSYTYYFKYEKPNLKIGTTTSGGPTGSTGTTGSTGSTGGTFSVGYGVTASGLSRNKSDLLFGHNPAGQTLPNTFAGSWANTWDTLEYQQAVGQFGGSVTQYPGGTLMNYWDWENETFITTSEYANTPYAYQGTGSAGPLPLGPAGSLSNFVNNIADPNGLETLWCANVYQSPAVRTPANVVGFLDAIASISTVNYVELGEEFYLSNNPSIIPDNAGYTFRFPTPASYGSEMVSYVSAIRSSAHSSSKVGIVGAIPIGPPSGRRRIWNPQCIPAYFSAGGTASLFDAMTLHAFSIVTNAQYADYVNWLLTAPNEQYSKISDGVNSIISVVQGWQYANSTPLLFSNGNDYPDIWMTGFNIQDDGITVDPNSSISGTWGHGLYCFALQSLMMEEVNIKVILYQGLSSSRNYGLWYNIPNGFGPGTTTIYDLTASGVIQVEFSNAYGACDSFDTLLFDTPTNTTNEILYGKVFYSPTGDQIVIGNLGYTDYNLDISGILGSMTIDEVRTFVASPTLQVNRKSPSGTKLYPNFTSASSIPDPTNFNVPAYAFIRIICNP